MLQIDTDMPTVMAQRGKANDSRKQQSAHRIARGTILEVAVDALQPTQMAVGMRAVTFKRRRIEQRYGRKKLEKVLAGRPIPTVRGPGGGLYIIDNHHFGLALWQAQVPTAFAQIVDDYAHLTAAPFFRTMEATGRLYPFDECGDRVAPSRLPAWLHALRHDPYRDLAWSVREAGGFGKVRVAYTEFLWANHFRENIPLSLIRRDYETAVARAMRLAANSRASYLPGWRGEV